MTGAKATARMFPEFLTGQPMQSREPLKHQEHTNNESQDTTLPIPETTIQNTPSGTINRLAEGLARKNKRSSAQILMVGPVSTTENLRNLNYLIISCLQ